MFICNECLVRNFLNEPSIVRSLGTCEFCSNVADCNDIPSGYLMHRKKENTSTKYYICPECGDLKTEEEINDDCSNGGMGMCSCKYIQMLWDVHMRGFEPITAREYVEYKEIPKEVYLGLKGIHNPTARLRAYGSWDHKW